MKSRVLALTSLFLLLFTGVFPLSALNLKDSLSKITVTDVYFGGASSYTSFSNISLYEMRQLTARSVLLQKDFSDYSYSSYMDAEGSRLYFGFSLGNYLNPEDKITYKLNIALSLSNSTPAYANLFNTDSIPYDTLTSSQTGNVFYVKKNSINSYNISYNPIKLTFDINGIVSTNPLRRFSFYTGLGIVYGIGLSTSTEVTHNNYYTYTPNIYNYNYSNQNEGIFETETLENQSGYSIGIYVPFGVQFRFGKQSKFWKRLYMYCEFTAGINSEYIPELGQFTGFFPGTRFGYKYYIGKLD